MVKPSRRCFGPRFSPIQLSGSAYTFDIIHLSIHSRPGPERIIQPTAALWTVDWSRASSRTCTASAQFPLLIAIFGTRRSPIRLPWVQNWGITSTPRVFSPIPLTGSTASLKFSNDTLNEAISTATHTGTGPAECHLIWGECPLTSAPLQARGRGREGRPGQHCHCSSSPCAHITELPSASPDRRKTCEETVTPSSNASSLKQVTRQCVSRQPQPSWASRPPAPRS